MQSYNVFSTLLILISNSFFGQKMTLFSELAPGKFSASQKGYFKDAAS